MAEILTTVVTWAEGDTHCILDVTFKDAVTGAAVNITGFTPKLRAKGVRSTAAVAAITGTLLTPGSGIARYDCRTIAAVADYYICQAYVVDGSSEIQTAEEDFAIVVKDAI